MWPFRGRRRPAVDHDQARIRAAADWAITSAGRRAMAGEVGHVTVADVRRRALEDFGMTIDEPTARAALRARLELRGTLGLSTDAWT